jgi:hypothetical protein
MQFLIVYLAYLDFGLSLSCTHKKPMARQSFREISQFVDPGLTVYMSNRVEWFYMGKFQNVNFEKHVVLKVPHDYNNKKNCSTSFQNFEIFHSRIGLED